MRPLPQSGGLRIRLHVDLGLRNGCQAVSCRRAKLDMDRGLTWINDGRAAGNMIVFQKEDAMSVNMGTLDRGLRVLVGLALIAFAIPIGFPATGWNWIGWIGVIPLITAVVGNCPAYSVFGLSTR